MRTNVYAMGKAPATRPGSDLAIVGGGAAAVALVAGLARSVKRHDVRAIDVLDVEGNLGPGRAYSTPSATHMMNTALKHSSIVSGDPRHLEKWLTSSGRPQAVHLPRQVYGEYLGAAGREAAQKFAEAQGRLSVLKAEVVDIATTDEDREEGFGYVLRAADGREYRAQKVVLAPGDPPPAPLSYAPGVAYFPCPWPFERLRDIEPHASVAIAGAGASAIDCCLYLGEDMKHTGPIELWSRSGQLPCVQRAPARPGGEITHAALDELMFTPGPLSLSQVKDAIDRDLAANFGSGRKRQGLAAQSQEDATTRFRKEVAAAEVGLPNHQDYVRSLRDLAPVLWRRLSAKGQRTFDELYHSLWNRYRHPVALGVAQPFLRLLEQGRVQLRCGTPLVVSGEPRVLINATGQDFAVERSGSPLIRSLLERGLASAHPRGGIRVDAALRVQTSRGEAQGLYAMGAVTRGSHFAVASIHALVRASELIGSQLGYGATANPADSSQ